MATKHVVTLSALTITTITVATLTGCSRMRCVNDANCPEDFTCVVDRCAEGVREDATPEDEPFVVGDGSEGEGEGEGEGELCPPPPGGFDFVRPPPNVMFLVDRSTSMAAPGECASGDDCGTKWEQMLALGPYLDVVQGRARFGLSVFPSPNVVNDSCGVADGLMVPLSDAPDIAQQIMQALQSLGPNGRTPIAAALDEASTVGLDDPTRDNVLVLLTDGQPNCACTEGDSVCEHDEAVAAVQRLAGAEVPITVDIIGFGASATEAGATLSAMAEAAGTALPGETKYFEARTIEELVERLFQLTAAAAPCRFALDDFPAPEDLTVHVDDGVVAACAEEAGCTNGYTYDQSNGTVELHGDACQAIRDGQCHDIWFEG